MIKKLIKHGNSKALLINKDLLKQLNIEDKIKIEITSDGVSLILTPIKTSKNKKITKISNRKEVQKGFEKILKKYDAVFKELASK
ncbi:TPA: AbrB family transcriptional regulator [Candidatus Dependentiae bacterium]|nr:MAG: hypothetical protein UR14_C0006G0029 [candidate division TM6 bacterium GW2011_GWE2_31_21]KKP53548.1 MAG: hypothetical protein UR43_C0004G0089 [candidate division TM6 bacterium GW2011_GWF2_33_332]HBS48211.1 AbrB family transcriptional regulator [Candidatus Dependentiae bacterium]HBZ73637.1 AbrB family transcriptional regulator [Candidatus Dependentiae bacterium]